MYFDHLSTLFLSLALIDFIYVCIHIYLLYILHFNWISYYNLCKFLNISQKCDFLKMASFKFSNLMG